MSLRDGISVSALLIGLAIVFGPSPDAQPWPAAASQDRPELDDAAKRAGFAHDGTGVASNRQALAAAIARSRPEAQRLVALVDGLVLVQFASPASGAVGTTSTVPKAGGRYIVQLDMPAAYRAAGQPGIDRLVLHELGHVVDFALVSQELRQQLFAGLASGYGCRRAGVNECAHPAEQFAETFAKWATGNVGVNVYMGYGTPLPRTSLDEWARPLTLLQS